MRKQSLKQMVLVLMMACLLTCPILAKDVVNITILHTNDTHANVKDDGKSVIGFAKLGTYINTLKQTENVLVLDAGDLFQGMPFANLEKGRSIVPIANAVGYDAMVAGNHEFDFGADNLQALSEQLNFPILAANVLKNNEVVYTAYMVKEFDGVKVGVFGLSTPETLYKTHPDNVKGYVFEDLVTTATNTVNQLREIEEVDVVIMLSHLGLDEGTETSDRVAESVPGIDIIIDGHSHTMLEKGRLINETLIASTGEKLQNIGRVTLQVCEGKVTSKEAIILGYGEFVEVEAMTAITEIIQAVDEAQQPLLEKVVGTTSVVLDGERENVRTGETNLGQLATDAMLDLTGADVVITNGGGIRKSIQPGNITMNDLVAVFPFGNTIMVKDIKGRDLVAALEHGVSDYPNQKGAFPHTAGITFTLNVNEMPGHRISDVKVGEQAIELEKMYSLATNDFMAAGGDGYEMFMIYPVKAEYNTLMDTLLAYVEKLGEIDQVLVPRMTLNQAPSTNPIVAVRAYAVNEGFCVEYDVTTKTIQFTKDEIIIQLPLAQIFELKDHQSYMLENDLKAVLYPAA